MNKKILVRAIIGLFTIAVLFLGYKWIEKVTKDPDFGTMDTTDMIAAVEYTEDGSHVVLFDAEGNKTEVPEFVEGSNDFDPVWRPDGQRVFFSSTRLGTSANVFRWNVAKNSVEHRLRGSRSAGSPYFGPPDWPNLEDSALVIIAGNVFEFNQHDQKTKQILPPLEFENTGDAEAEQQQALYERLGTSFKSAKWGKDRKVMYTVMTRENDELFLVNYMEAIGDQPAGPVALLAGQSIQFDVAPNGTVVVSVQGFEFPDEATIPADMIVNGKAIKPWRNALFATSIDDDGHVGQMLPLFLDQPELGVEPLDLTATLRTEKSIPTNVVGVLAGQVLPKSAGDTIGIRTGDVIVNINGQPTVTPIDLFTVLRNVRLGIPATISFWSAGENAIKSADYAFGSENTMVLKDPAFSPDSNTVAAVVGFVIDKYNYEPRELVLISLTQGLNGAQRLVSGRIFEPNWHPSGNKLTYVLSGEGGDSEIYVIGADGSGQKNLSGPGDFGSPRFSPYKKK